MVRLFISLYAGTLATLFAMLFVSHYISTYLIVDVDNLIDAQEFSAEVELLELLAPQLNFDEVANLLELIGKRNQLIITEVDLSNIPASIQAELAKQQVWYDDEQHNYFRAFEPTRYFMLSEDPDSKLLAVDSLTDWVFLTTLILTTALCCLGWLLLLKRKLQYLERATDRLSQGDLTARAPLSKRKAVGKLNSRFNEMAAEIERLISSHKQLTQTVAHELRTPLFRMQMQLEMLAAQSSDNQSKYILGLEDDIYQLQQLIDEILQFSKLERSQLRLEYKTFAINSFLNELCGSVNKEHQVNIKLLINTTTAEFCADEILLRRLLRNLLTNAIKYGDQQINLVIHQHEQQLTFIVEDDGPGIAVEQRNKIFEPFYRIDNHANQPIPGYGLGLAICKDIARLHQGQLTVDTSEQGGAAFCLTIPLNLKTRLGNK